MKEFSTSEIARMVQVHPNTIMLYEKWGYMEPVRRKDNGYRVYTERHLEQVKIARIALRCDFTKAYLRRKATDVVKAAAKGNLEQAWNCSKVYLEHIQYEKNNDLRLIDEIQQIIKENEHVEDSVTLKRIEAARLIGVSIDAVINWERNGLIDVPRDKKNGYRVYGKKEIGILKVIRVLRSARYSMMALYRMVNQIGLDEGDSMKAEQVVNHLLSFLTEAENDAKELMSFINELIEKEQQENKRRIKMKEEFIILKGCRENNLKNVSLQIPKRKISIFTGVSGSGKSSIVFETIGKEAQRQLNETFSAFVRNFLPKYGDVKADHIENLSTPILIDQKRMGSNSRSTLGTISDINPLFRILFSRVGQPYIGFANKFSFNDISGMCPECEGLGKKMTVDLDQILDQSKSINEGAILLSGFNIGSWPWRIFAESGFFDNDKKIADFTKEELEKFLYGESEKIKLKDAGSMNISYEGLIVKFNRLYLKKETELSESAEKKLSKLMIEEKCPSCHGARYNQEVLNCFIKGYHIADLLSMQLDELLNVVVDINIKEVQPIIESIKEKLNNFIDIGLGYLTLDRETSTLSGGESQRVKMVKHLNSSLIDLMYIFDEPSIGLHPRDVHKLNNLLEKLRDKGNTMLVVEHDPDVIKIADHIVDVGPYAGTKGGTIVYEGSYNGLLASGTLTGNALKKSLAIKEAVRAHQGYLEAVNCNSNNLKNVSVKVPKGVLTVVTGVAGSGKSTLMKHEFLKQNKEVILIDQSAVSANSRSNLATYSGIMDNIRKVFAKANDANASLFSYNSEGACENCNGSGIIETGLSFMDSTKITCEVCEGKRFKKEVLEYTFQGKNIIDVLDMTVSEALLFFKEKQIKTKLQSLEEMGIGYLTLGQTLDTLSGGECQRLKLANEIHKAGSVYVMDEPSTGLHMSDIEKFIGIVNNIVDNGNTVIIIEHNIDIIRNADWVIDLGPEGGQKGGEIMFEGTPLELRNCERSITAKYI